MNTFLHQSHAQLQADAIRSAYRNPPRPQIDAPPTQAKRSRFARMAHPFHHRGAVAPAA
jgi:hypothetical protein